MLDGNNPFVRFRTGEKIQDGDAGVVATLNPGIECRALVIMPGPPATGRTTCRSERPRGVTPS